MFSSWPSKCGRIAVGGVSVGSMCKTSRRCISWIKRVILPSDALQCAMSAKCEHEMMQKSRARPAHGIPERNSTQWRYYLQMYISNIVYKHIYQSVVYSLFCYFDRQHAHYAYAASTVRDSLDLLRLNRQQNVLNALRNVTAQVC